MKKNLLLMLILHTNINCVLPKKPWTTFMYFAGHNDLYSFLQGNLNSLPQGANSNVNIVSSFNAFAGCSTPPNCKTVTTQRYTTTNSGNTQTGSTINNLNTGSQTTLINEMTFAINEAPCTNFAMFLGGHGLGATNGCCLDQLNSSILLNDAAVQAALKAAVTLRGKKTDILALDCCIMASLEYYYAWANYVHYIISSEETEPGDGFPYNTILSLLKNNQTPEDFAKGIVNTFNKTYSTELSGVVNNFFTLSAVDASKIKLVAQNINKLAGILLGLLKSNQKTTVNLINQAISNITRFATSSPNGGQGAFVDVNALYTNLVQSAKGKPVFSSVVATAKEGMHLIKEAVIRNGTDVPGASGITIFTPIFPGKFVGPTYSQTIFAQAFPNWINFLKAFNAATNNS